MRRLKSRLSWLDVFKAPGDLALTVLKKVARARPVIPMMFKIVAFPQDSNGSIS